MGRLGGLFASAALVGVLLLIASAVLIVGDSDGLSSRMPTQLPPRRFARYPMIAGLALVVIGIVGSFVP